MSDYTQVLTMKASADAIFDFVSRAENLPKYLPTARRARPQPEGKVEVEGEVRGHRYDDTGYMRVNAQDRTMDWGSDGEDDYSGHMEVRSTGPVTSQVSVTVKLNPKPEEARQMQQMGKSVEDVLREGVDKALLSIKLIVEGEGGKVENMHDPSISARSPINYNMDK
ncbi:MAG TPA: SRPBCC family protein [Chloroflexia bacterium]|nr:SRPBCC family protein [Chloroflexia bacterium]